MKRLSLFFLGMMITAGAFSQAREPIDFTDNDFRKIDYSDYRRYFTIGWDINIPLVNRENVSDASFRGVKFGYREKISDHFFMGIDLNSANYNSYIPRKTYVTDATSLTTDYHNYVYSYGGTLAGEYYFQPEKRLMPFVGIGVGGNYNIYKTFYNIYGDSDNSWGFLVRPQAGAIIKLGPQSAWGIIASVHYDYSSSKSEKFGYPDFSNVGFRLGIVVLDFD